MDIIYFNKENESFNYFHNFLSSGNIFDNLNNINENEKNLKNKTNYFSTCKSNEKNLLIIFNLFSNKIKRIFFSNCRITDCITLGKNENFILTCREDGIFDIFDIKKNDEVYYNYKISEVNITREIKTNKNIDNNNDHKNQNEAYDKNIGLPFYSTYDTIDTENIIKMENEIFKIIKKTNNDSNRIYALDKRGNLLIMVSSIKGNKMNSKNNKSNIYNCKSQNLLKKLYEIKLKDKLKPLLKGNDLKCFDIKRLQNENDIFNNDNLNANNVNFYQDIFLINSNLGLIKLTLIGKNDFNIRIIYNNFEEKNLITAFDLSDTGLILVAFSDLTIKVIDIENFTSIFQVNLPMEAVDTTLNKVFWASVICKNEKKKLIRRSLTANFFVITSKNEFIIYDLNQKNKVEIKKIKKKIELGAKKGLNRKNSFVDFSYNI